MKVFLDIDGVMVHGISSKKLLFEDDGFYKFNPSAIEYLNEIAPLEIILSTSHRFTYSLEEWETIFINRGIKFSEITRIETPVDNSISRKDEILNWIETNDLSCSDILIIDDDKSLTGLPRDSRYHLILTNPYTGLVK